MKRFIPLLTFIFSISFFADVKAQLPSVAIVASDDAANMADVQSKLVNTGFFDIVDIIDVNSSTPTLATLQTYDAILAYTNFAPFDANRLCRQHTVLLVPLWLPFGPFALRRYIRRKRGLCPKCGYPIGKSSVFTECRKALPGREVARRTESTSGHPIRLAVVMWPS